MIEKKRFLLKCKKVILSGLVTTSIITSVSGCAKREETYPEVKPIHKGAYIIIDDQNRRVDLIEDKSITGLEPVKRK